MADICISAVSADVQPNCSNPTFSGLEQIGYLLNKADVGNYTKELSRSNVFTSIPAKEGKRAYRLYVNTKNPFDGTQTEMEQGDVANLFTHTVAFIVRDDGPDVNLNVITPLANGEFVAILEEKWKNVPKDNSFVVFGMSTGLVATSIAKPYTDEANAGAWQIELQESGAAQSAMYLWAGSYDTTKQMLESMSEPQQAQP